MKSVIQPVITLFSVKQKGIHRILTVKPDGYTPSAVYSPRPPSTRAGFARHLLHRRFVDDFLRFPAHPLHRLYTLPRTLHLISSNSSPSLTIVLTCPPNRVYAPTFGPGPSSPAPPPGRSVEQSGGHGVGLHATCVRCLCCPLCRLDNPPRLLRCRDCS